MVEPAGDHSGDYWSAYVPDYLRFYGIALSATEAPTSPEEERALLVDR